MLIIGLTMLSIFSIHHTHKVHLFWRTMTILTRFTLRTSLTSVCSYIRGLPWNALGGDEISGSRTFLEHLLLRNSEHFDNAGELIVLVLAGEQRKSGQKFNQDAPEAPHVDHSRVPAAQDHLRASEHVTFDIYVYRRNSTSAEEVDRFQRLFHNPSWLTPGKTSGHQKLVPTFPWIYNCLNN